MLAEQTWHKIFEMPHILFIIGCLIARTAILGSFWYKAQKLQSENALKQMLVVRGMSAHEIERIMVAGYHEESETLNNCRWPSFLSVAISTR